MYLRRKLAQLVQVGAQYAHRHRRCNRGALHELAHRHLCAGIAGKLGAQAVYEARRGLRVILVQLHKDLAQIGRIVAHDLVVIDLRIAMTEVAEPAADLGVLGQLLFDLAYRVIGGLKAAAVGGFDADQKLWRVRLGK